MMHWDGYGGGWYIWMWLFHVSLPILVILIVWWIVRSSRGYGFRSDPGESALDILKKRLARGEISEAEFKRLKKDIE